MGRFDVINMPKRATFWNPLGFSREKGQIGIFDNILNVFGFGLYSSLESLGAKRNPKASLNPLLSIPSAYIFKKHMICHISPAILSPISGPGIEHLSQKLSTCMSAISTAHQVWNSDDIILSDRIKTHCRTVQFWWNKAKNKRL